MGNSFPDTLLASGLWAWAHILLLGVPMVWLVIHIEWQEFLEWRASHPEGYHFNFHLFHHHNARPT